MSKSVLTTRLVHPWDSFDTDIDMAQAVDNDVWKQPMFGASISRTSLSARKLITALRVPLGRLARQPCHRLRKHLPVNYLRIAILISSLYQQTVAEFDRLYNTSGLGVFSLNAVSMEDSLL